MSSRNKRRNKSRNKKGTAGSNRQSQNQSNGRGPVRDHGRDDGHGTGAPVASRPLRPSTETKRSLRTTELALYAVAVLAVVMAALAVDADGDGQRGLADTAGPDDLDEPTGGQQVADGAGVGSAADELGGHRREVAGRAVRIEGPHRGGDGTEGVRGGAHGIILSRKYSEMNLANLSAAGAVAKEAGLT